MPAPGRLRGIVDQVPKDLFIGGAWRPAAGGRTFAVEDPSTGEVLWTVPRASGPLSAPALDPAAGPGGTALFTEGDRKGTAAATSTSPRASVSPAPATATLGWWRPPSARSPR